MIEKHKRIVDNNLLKKMKEIDHCELCGSHTCVENAHIVSKGAYGPDIKENIVRLCGPARYGMGCHGNEHKGNISKDELFAVVAKREGKTTEEIKDIVNKAWRFGIYDENSSSM